MQAVVEIASVSSHEIRMALGYYAEFPDEIDAWLQHIDEESERASEGWKRAQAAHR